MLGSYTLVVAPMGVKFAMEEGTLGPLHYAKFHPRRCNVSPLCGEKSQNRPLNKLNTGRLALRAMLPVKRRHKKFEPRVRVWKVNEEQTCEEYKSMVRDKVEEEEWKHLDVNEQWHTMKKDNDLNSTAHMWNLKRPLQT